MRRIVLSAFLTIGLALPSAAIDPGLLQLADPKVNLLVGIRMGELASSPLMLKVLAESKKGGAQWSGLIDQWGDNPFAGIDELLIMGRIEPGAQSDPSEEALIVAVIMVESGGNARAVSPAGAEGLAQLMPGTARRYGVSNSFNPGQNLAGSAAYLSDLIGMFKGDVVLALAAYNAGEHAVLRHKGVPPYRETRAYVPKVLAAFQLAGQYCARPPRAARRRCQFRRHLR